MRAKVGAATAAAPRVEETVPSMPLAPRLERMRMGRSPASKKASMSRTGIEEPT